MIFAVGTYTFERDLFRFVTRIETAQLQTFASEIEDYFAEVQTWDFLRENPRMADLILRQRRSFDENLIILPNVLNERRRFRFSFNKNQDIERPGRLYLLDENLEVVIGNETILNEISANEAIDMVLEEQFILSPINFENNLAFKYLDVLSNHIFFEDESRTIGRLVIPEKFYHKMSLSNFVLIEEPIEKRIENIYNEYVVRNLKKKNTVELSIYLRKKLAKISNRLGGVKYSQVDKLIQNAFENSDEENHYKWIEILLISYYDKMYEYQLEQKKDRCIHIGSWLEIFEYLSNYKSVSYTHLTLPTNREV